MMNVIWTLFNLVILSVATAVAWESQQRRQTVRVAMSVPAGILLPDGTVYQGETEDISNGGVMLKVQQKVDVEPGEVVRFVFPVLDGDATLPATIISSDSKYVRAYFAPLSIQEEEALTMVLYSRADTWLGWGEARDADQPIRSLYRIFQLAIFGVKHAVSSAFRKSPQKSKLATTAPLVLLLLLGLGATSSNASAQRRIMNAPMVPAAAQQDVAPGYQNGPYSGLPTGMRMGPPGPGDSGLPQRPVAPGKFDNIFTIADVSSPDTIVMRGVDSYHSVYFAVPQTQNVRTATMKLYYHFSPGLLPMISHLKVSLNGTLFATLPVTTRPAFEATMENDSSPQEKLDSQRALLNTRVEQGALLEANLTIPSEMLVHNNELTFEFVGHYTLKCEDPSHTTLWSHVDSNSSIELAGDLLPLQNDLKLLPLPFYDVAVNLHPSIPIVFLSQPSKQALQAAGIIASWFGILTDYHPVQFPVTFGSIPQGNAILISENSAELPATMAAGASGGPSIAMRTNPRDPYAKLLVVSGDTPDQLVMAAQSLTQQFDHLAGEVTHVNLGSKPRPRDPDDAPRWLKTDRINTIGDLSQQGDLQGDGTVPVGIYSRVPPDLFYGDRQNLAFHLYYRYNGIPLANESTLQIYQNGAYVSSTPMPHTDKASADLTTVIPVPVVDMRPFSNTTNAKFVFQIAKKGYCQDTAPMNLQGSIRKDSYLDLRDIPHWAQLPNLEIFANAGYPFTRRADLSDTAIVLPDNPEPEEIEMYLAMMGHFGAQTGYPVLNVSVTDAAGMNADKDYFVMGTIGDSPAINKLNDHLPVRIGDQTLRIQDTRGFFDQQQHAWWKVRSSDRVETGSLETAGGMPDAIIEGLESPMNHGRSVVLLVTRDKSVIPNFLQLFLKNSQSSDIRESVSVMTGNRFASYRLGNDYYHVGSLGFWIRVRLFFAQYPWMLVAAALLACLLIAVLLRAVLRRQARHRLQAI